MVLEAGVESVAICIDQKYMQRLNQMKNGVS